MKCRSTTEIKKVGGRWCWNCIQYVLYRFYAREAQATVKDLKEFAFLETCFVNKHGYKMWKDLFYALIKLMDLYANFVPQ